MIQNERSNVVVRSSNVVLEHRLEDDRRLRVRVSPSMVGPYDDKHDSDGQYYCCDKEQKVKLTNENSTDPEQ